MTRIIKKSRTILLLTTATIHGRSAAFPIRHATSVLRNDLANGVYRFSTKADEDFFLRQVETTVQKVLSSCSSLDDKKEEDNILALPFHQREAVGVARHLHKRIQALRRNNDCPRCWMQRAHCICPNCPPATMPTESQKLKRIFLLMHHKEIAMKIDTAKLILAAFPHQCRLVVGGIGPEYQDSMKEMMQAMQNNTNCLVLFPDENARTFQEIVAAEESKNHGTSSNGDEWDVIVLDGTWAQARKLHARYLSEDGGPRRVQLSEEAVQMLQEQKGDNRGHQLRRHSITWRQVGTFEATRIFLRDFFWDSHQDPPVWEQIQNYQEIANQAAKRELGPPRTSSSSPWKL